jgi:hypothetical protein
LQRLTFGMTCSGPLSSPIGWIRQHSRRDKHGDSKFNTTFRFSDRGYKTTPALPSKERPQVGLGFAGNRVPDTDMEPSCLHVLPLVLRTRDPRKLFHDFLMRP